MSTIILASPNQYGYFTIYYNYAKYLSSEVKVMYICFDQGEQKFEETKNISVIYISLSTNKIRNIFNYYKAIISVFKTSGPATLLIKYYYFSSLLNLILPGKDLVLDIRTGYISENRIKTFYFNSIIKIESLLFRRIIILSESLRKKLGLGVRKTTIIPLGAEQVVSDHKESDRLILLYLGTLSSRNIGQTVEGLSLFLKNDNRNTEIKYHIVGGGKPAEVEELKETISRLNLDTIVKYEGPVYGKELNKFLISCNVGISYIPTIKDYDCQPATKTVEYLMAGMPVIATATYENKKIITEYNGILIHDDPQSFSDGLEKFISIKKKFNYSIITDSVKEYTFQFIVENKLKPLLFS